jgi:MbtH protein
VSEEAEVDDERTYDVVVNDEEQYSIWAVEAPLPDGWRAAGFRSTREQCLDHIQAVWTDMRPLSLRRALEAAARPEHGRA